ncbi:MAG: quinolinate synthase NadA [Bdellovibrionales bacterium]
MDALNSKIKELKAKHNALILAHYYEESSIQDLADHVGDSLFLAQQGQKAKNPVVLLAGVVFMAETVKILAPEKTVLAPDLAAGCSLVEHSPAADYRRWRLRHPDAICATYVNSSAEVKALSDVIVTSSNAEKIIRAIPAGRKILFGPDRNLGRYLAKKIGREMELWPGACEVHVLFSARKMFELKLKHPKAVVLAHPECVDEVLEQADVIGSTSKLLEEVGKNPATEFIVATEPGILHQMQKSRPDARLFEAPAEGSCACNECPYMKLNTREKIALAFTNLKPAIDVKPEVAQQARRALNRMMTLTEGGSVTWPERFADELALSARA